MRTASPPRPRDIVHPQFHPSRPVPLAQRPTLFCIIKTDACDSVRRVFAQIREAAESEKYAAEGFEFIEFESAAALEAHVQARGGAQAPCLLVSHSYEQSFFPIARTRKQHLRFACVPDCVDWMVYIGTSIRESRLCQCASSLPAWFSNERFGEAKAKRSPGKVWLPWGVARKNDYLIGESPPVK